MKNIAFLAFIALFIAVAFVIVSVNTDTTITGSSLGPRIAGGVINGANVGEVQVVKLYVEGGNYVLEPSTVKQGIRVRIEADVSRMPGCSKSVVIPSFNIAKGVNSQDNIIEFTPDKSGTFNIVCSMNMYKGTFEVLESDGTKSDYVEKTPAGGHTCGAGGGCGCGG